MGKIDWRRKNISFHGNQTWVASVEDYTTGDGWILLEIQYTL